MSQRRIRSRHLLFVALATTSCAPFAFAQDTARSEPPPTLPAARASVGPSERLADEVYCGDAVSEALHSRSQDMPCWADLRSVDRFHTVPVPDGELLRSAADNGMQPADVRRASFTAGLIGGTSLVGNAPNPQGYGGIAAVAATIGHRRWQLSVEDVGSGADLRAHGTNSPVGLNRGALRFRAALTPRLLTQLRITNSIGTDAYRLLAPLDYRTVGTSLVPVADTASYGLYKGRVLSGQEDLSIRYAASRRTSWDFAAVHSLRNYSDAGATVQTLRGRATVLHALNPGIALGVFATAATQTSTHTARVAAPACSFAGGGIAAESRWANRLTFDLAAGAAASTSGCGNTVQPIGRAALSLRASTQTTVYLAAERDLGAGILLSTPVLNSASVGMRRSLGSGAGFNVDAGGLLGSHPATHQQSSAVFADADVHFRLGAHLLQQTSVRRFQSARFDRPAGIPGGQTAITFSLWVTSRSPESGGR